MISGIEWNSYMKVYVLVDSRCDCDSWVSVMNVLSMKLNIVLSSVSISVCVSFDSIGGDRNYLVNIG